MNLIGSWTNAATPFFAMPMTARYLYAVNAQGTGKTEHHTLHREHLTAAKSAVDRRWNRVFLGFTVSANRGYKLKVSTKALKNLKHKVRTLTRRTRGHSVNQIIAELRKILLGWKAYFGIAQVKSPQRDLDKRIRRKFRCYILKQWGRSRVSKTESYWE